MIDSIETKTDALRKTGSQRRETLVQLKKQLDCELTFQEMALSQTPLARLDVRRMAEIKAQPHSRVRALRESYNMFKAMRFLERCVPKAPREIGEAEIFALHALLLAGFGESHAAQYRTDSVCTRDPGAAVDASEIPAAMQELFEWLRSGSRQHPVKQAVDMHLRVSYTHPFRDMNGRMARLLANLLLMQRGLPPAILLGEQRAEYADAVAKAPKDGGWQLAQIYTSAVERGLDFCLENVERSTVPALSLRHG